MLAVRELCLRVIGGKAAALSAASVANALLALDGAGDSIAEGVPSSLKSLGFGRLVLGHDVADLIRLELVDLSASGACELQGLQILPSDRYLEVVAAIVGNADPDAVSVLHGWPILSVDVRTTTVADAAGESILGGGGLAA